MATVLVNPYGLELPHAWWIVLTADLPKIIEEHAPLDPSEASGALVLLFGAIYLFALLGTGRRARLVWLLPLVLLFLAVTRIRHGPLFALAATLAIAEMLPFTYWAARLQQRGSDLIRPPNSPEKRRSNWFAWALPALLVTITAVLQLAQVQLPVFGRNWAKLDAQRWPTELLSPLKERQGKETPVPIFNELLYGGFLIYHTPGYRVFIDDRAELYGKEFLQAYDYAAREAPEQVDAWQQKYGFRLALVHRGSSFDAYLRDSKRWHLVTEAGPAALYEREASQE